MAECQQCRADVARFESTLAAFGGAVRDWSEQQSVVRPLRDGRRARPFRWAGVAAAALLVVAVPIYRQDQQRRAERARADAVLMEQVDVAVSRVTAAPMEPLAKLMTWDENR